MKFERKSKHHIESACGRYTVSAAIAGGAVVYTAWRKNTAREAPTMLLTADSPGACKAACVADSHAAEVA